MCLSVKKSSHVHTVVHLRANSNVGEIREMTFEVGKNSALSFLVLFARDISDADLSHTVINWGDVFHIAWVSFTWLETISPVHCFSFELLNISLLHILYIFQRDIFYPRPAHFGLVGQTSPSDDYIRKYLVFSFILVQMTFHAGF